MKTPLLIFITYFGSALISLPNHIESDYRDAYCGNYNCRRIYKHLNTNNSAIVIDTTWVTVNVAKHEKDSVLSITTSEGVFPVKLINSKFISFNNSRCGGRFYSDSLYFHRIPSPGPFSFIYIGKK